MLLVEDDADVGEVLVELLQDADYQVSWVQNGHEALLHLQREPLPVAIICDLQMPLMDGHSLVEQLGRSPRLSAIPVLVVSGSVPSWSAPHVRFLRKPFTNEQMLEQLSEITRPPRP